MVQSGTARYVDPLGQITAAGAAFLRSHFERATQTGSRSTATMSDAELSHELAQNWRWLEALNLAELAHQWQALGGPVTDLRTRASGTAFAFARASISMRSLLRYINRAIAAHTSLPPGNGNLLNTDTGTYLRQLIASNDPLITPIINEIKSRFPNDWRQFERGGRMAMFGDTTGAIGNKQPDIVEIDLAARRIAITDITQAYNDPRHHLKTALYMRVFESMFPGFTVVGSDYRRPGQSRDF